MRFAQSLVAASAAFALVILSPAQVPDQLLHSIPPPSLTSDRFGESVAVSGTKLVVGAFDGSSVSVYDIASATPSLPVATLINPMPGSSDFFGSAVAIAGTKVVVGAHGHAAGDAGSVFVFDLASATPGQSVATLINPDPSIFDNLGFSVSISGDWVIAGVPGEDTGANNAGSAYVYNLASATPSVPAFILNNPTPASDDMFGSSVAISGSLVVVGAYHDDTGASDAGSAYVFDLNGPSPTAPVAILNNPTPELNDSFGESVAIFGRRVVVGAPRDRVETSPRGRVFVYNLDSAIAGVPVAIFNPPAGAMRFGRAVAISGARIAVGGPGLIEVGNAYVYDLDGVTPFEPAAVLNNPTPDLTDGFGHSVSIDGAFAAVGAPTDDTVGNNEGYAYVFGPVEISGPGSGSFSVNPPSPVTPATTLMATFTGWIDDSLPLTYSARVGSTVIVPPGSNPNPTFVLPEGTHLIYGRITDSIGNFTDTAATTIVVDGAAPGISAPVGGFDPLTLIEGSPLPNYAAQAVVTDDTAVASVTQTPPAGSPVPRPFLGPVTLTATDTAGNAVNFDILVTVVPPAPSTSLLYAKGGAVPEAGTDARIQAGAAWSKFGPPAINSGGNVTYLGQWKAPVHNGTIPLPVQRGTGIFVDDVLIVKAGDSVPGLVEATFSAFKNPVISDGGHVAFIASIAGPGVSSANDSVVVTNGRTGVLEVLAREGEFAPGTGGATFKRFIAISIEGTAAAGGTLFTASLQQSASVTAGNDSGAWWQPAGEIAVSKVVREGDPVGTEFIRSFSVLKTLSRSPGHGRGQVDGDTLLLQLSLTGASKPRQAVVLAKPGSVTEVAGTDNPLAGVVLPTARWSKLNLPSFGNLGANMAVAGTLAADAGGVTNGNDKGIFLSDDGGTSWAPLSRTGYPAPGFDVGETFSAFKDPVNSSTGPAVAFIGAARGGGVLSTNNDGVWFSPDGVALELLARERDEPPGPAGAEWKAFSSLALPGGDTGPLFTASLVKGVNSTPGPGGITSLDDFALYGVDSAFRLHELLRENQPLLGKTVKNFNVLKAASGSFGVGRSYNANGEVVAMVSFTDGTTSLVRIKVH